VAFNIVALSNRKSLQLFLKTLYCVIADLGAVGASGQQRQQE
jgi:hypothetical protein